MEGMKYEDMPFSAGKKKTKTTAKKQPVKKETVTSMNKQQYKQVKKKHKAEIEKLKQDIKKHKLLMKQAKLAYKIKRMGEK